MRQLKRDYGTCGQDKAYAKQAKKKKRSKETGKQRRKGAKIFIKFASGKLDNIL